MYQSFIEVFEPRIFFVMASEVVTMALTFVFLGVKMHVKTTYSLLVSNRVKITIMLSLQGFPQIWWFSMTKYKTFEKYFKLNWSNLVSRHSYSRNMQNPVVKSVYLFISNLLFGSNFMWSKNRVYYLKRVRGFIVGRVNRIAVTRKMHVKPLYILFRHRRRHEWNLLKLYWSNLVSRHSYSRNMQNPVV